jgi:TolB-like protein/Flp pilus assembly protein TadD
MRLVSELRRRNVFRMAVLYVVAAWLIMQVADTLIDLAKLPDWIGTTTLGLLGIGFPIALISSWFYELTPEGISLEKDVAVAESITHVTGRRMDLIVISLLCAAVIFFAYDKWWIAPPSVHSIAVLPFENMSDDPGNEYFSDGVSEEILNLLAEVPKLQVTSRSSAFSFKGQNLDVPTMAARLNVAHVLEGSVRKFGKQLRVTAQLIEVKSDTHLWSKTYDRELKNVFAIQDDIAAAVVDALKITLLGEKPKSTETNPEAYALYLQARQTTRQQTAEGLKQAETLLEQALEIDPGYAPAWGMLAHVYERQAQAFGPRPLDEGIELARHAIQRALAIDPQDGGVYAVLAWVDMFYDWDFTAAHQNLQQASKLNPGDAWILVSAARLNNVLGRPDEAIDLLRQSVALDPVSSGAHFWLGLTLYYAGRLDEAADSFQMVLSLSPGSIVVHKSLGLVLLAQGDAPAALLAMEQEPADRWRLHGTAIVQHVLGDAKASDAALQGLIECCAAEAAAQVAEVYAFRGEIDNAFDWLQRAYDNRDGGIVFMLVNPLLANLHDDPRWEPFLDKMGFPH